jgi:diguanylate cyclase (GGDEF)-like protein
MGEGISLALEPFQSFDDAARAVLSVLHERLGLGAWMILRDHGDSGTVLTVDDHGYGVAAGQVCRWTGDLTSQFPGHRAIAISVDQDDLLSSFPLRDFAPVRAYIGAPLYLTDGDLFGALCGIDPEPLAAQMVDALPLIELAARLLTSVLEMELKAQHATRRADRIEAESKLDPLTGLYNRRGWETLFERENARCLRYGNSGAVISLDLDDLKKVNDADGHAAGDRLIAAAARCLSQVVRNTDVVARLGGDEFGVLLVEARAHDAETLLNRIRSRLAMEQVNASIGCAVRDPMLTLYDALARADDAMYEDKRSRKAALVV